MSRDPCCTCAHHHRGRCRAESDASAWAMLRRIVGRTPDNLVAHSRTAYAVFEHHQTRSQKLVPVRRCEAHVEREQ